MFALKTTFSCSHSSGQRRRHLTNFLVNSTFMVAMLVKLLFLIVSSTSPATSFEGRFSRSKYALCFKRFSSIFVFLFSARLPIQLSWCEMETPFSDLLGLSAFLRLTEILLGVHYLFLGLPENISARHSQRVLEYGLLYNGLFTRFQWMIANQQRIACPPPAAINHDRSLTVEMSSTFQLMSTSHLLILIHYQLFSLPLRTSTQRYEVCEKLPAIKPSKAPGLDNVSCRIVKEFAQLRIGWTCHRHLKHFSTFWYCSHNLDRVQRYVIPISKATTT